MRFIAERTGGAGSASRHRPFLRGPAPAFKTVLRGHLEPDPDEIEENPRSRSAKLRAAERTAAPAWPLDLEAIGVPLLERERRPC